MTPLKLDRREQIAVSISGFALLIVLFLLLYIPAGPRRHYTQAKMNLTTVQGNLRNAQLLRAEEETRLQSQQKIMDRLQKRDPKFDFFSFVNNKLQDTQLTQRAQLDIYKQRNAPPNEPMLRLQLHGVNLKELIDLLHKLYSSGNLIVVYKMDRLHPAGDEKGLDCDLTLVTLKT